MVFLNFRKVVRFQKKATGKTEKKSKIEDDMGPKER